MVGERLWPETDESVTAAHTLRDPVAVLRELRRLVDRRPELALVDREGRAVLARPVQIGPTSLDLVTLPEHIGSPVLASRALTLVAILDEVKVQGDVSGPLLVSSDGRVRLVFPTALVRLQRRSNYRVRPIGDEVYLHAHGLRYPVLDLSVRGVGLAPVGAPPLVGERWEGCHLQLGLDRVPLDAVVRASDGVRVGCAFDPLSPAVEQPLARRLIEWEHRWMRARGTDVAR